MIFEILESYVIETSRVCNDTYLMSSRNIHDAKQECENNANWNNFHDVCNRGQAFHYCRGAGSIVPSNCDSILYRKGNLDTSHQSEYCKRVLIPI